MEVQKQIQQLLTDVNEKLSVKGEDGQVISITEVLQKFPELSVKYADLETRLKEMETKLRERKWATDAVEGLQDEKKKFSIFRALNAIRSGDWSEAGLEQEVFRQTKAMATSTDTAGGFLVPVQAMPEFIEMLRAEMVCVALGARMISGLTGSPVQFPKQNGGATAYWIGENTSITPSDLTFGQLQMTPKKIAALVQVSNELISMAQPEAEAIIRQDIAKTLGLAMDLAALRGTGLNNQPKGIANSSDILTVVLGDNGDTLKNFDLFINMEGKLEDANSLRGQLGFAFAPVIKRNAKKLKVAQFSGDTGGAYVVPRPVSDPELKDYLGWDWKATTQIPTNLVKGNATNCTEVYFANWQELLIGQWQGLEILASNVAGTAFATDQTWVRIISRMDVGLRHPESFCLCNDLKIA